MMIADADQALKEAKNLFRELNMKELELCESSIENINIIKAEIDELQRRIKKAFERFTEFESQDTDDHRWYN